MAHLQARSAPTRFKTIVQADVPQGRNEKHKSIVTMIVPRMVSYVRVLTRLRVLALLPSPATRKPMIR